MLNVISFNVLMETTRITTPARESCHNNWMEKATSWPCLPRATKGHIITWIPIVSSQPPGWAAACSIVCPTHPSEFLPTLQLYSEKNVWQWLLLLVRFTPPQIQCYHQPGTAKCSGVVTLGLNRIGPGHLTSTASHQPHPCNNKQWHGWGGKWLNGKETVIAKPSVWVSLSKSRPRNDFRQWSSIGSKQVECHIYRGSIWQCLGTSWCHTDVKWVVSRQYD